MAQIRDNFNAAFYSVSGEPHTSLSTPLKNGCHWIYKELLACLQKHKSVIEEPASFQKINHKNTKVNIKPKQQYKCKQGPKRHQAWPSREL